MKTRPSIFHPCAAAAVLALPAAFGAVVNLTPAIINQGNTATTSFTDASVTLTPYIGTTPDTFNANATRLGIDNHGTNNNAFNDIDTDPNNGNEEKLQMVFASNAGLTQISWDFARADGPGAQSGVIITGFTADPGATLSGGVGTGTVTYNAGALLLKLPGAAFGGTAGFLKLASRGASAGQTLLLSVTDEDQAGAQIAIRGISYEDALTFGPPVITTGLPATLAPVADTMATLSVTASSTTYPGATYNWEFNNGGGFVSVSTTPTYTFTAGTATDGTYRVTLTNSQGSATSSTVVTSVDDGDGINNQWEINFFGDYLLYGADDDVDLDGLTNAQEFAAGTNPTNPDTDGDGLLDGAEAANNVNPLVADTDGDGYSDGYEVNTSGTLPNDPASTPGVSSGRNSIGLTFSSTRGPNPGANLTTFALAGAPGYVQKNWNITGALGNFPSFDNADVIAPSPADLVDNAGVTTGMTFQANVASSFSVKNNTRRPYDGLFSGYLFVTQAASSGFFDLNSIPYARYDLVVYLTSLGGGANEKAYIREENSGVEYDFTPPAILANGADPVWDASADRSNVSSGTAENFPRATHVVFRGLTAASANLTLTFIAGNIGISAVQVVEDLDTDGDGMGDFYETSVGLDPADNGTGNSAKQGANGDFDGDGISNIDEYKNSTNPTLADTDGDGYSDAVETDTGTFVSTSDTGTDPRLADTDKDGLKDGVETKTGVFVSATNAGTDPFSDPDSDADGYRDSYEVLNGPTNPFDATSPGGPNPNGFAIAFAAAVGVAGGPAVEFGPLVYAGAPAVAQKNWNRTAAVAGAGTPVTGGTADIATPNPGQLVNSAGAPIGATFTFASGGGAYSSVTDALTPYGRLYDAFIYGRSAGDPDASVSLSGIPYPNYDVYVYFGSESDGRIGTLSSTTAGKTYSFTTASSGALANTVGSTYARTTDTGTGFPRANYAVFQNQTSATFDVKATVGANQNSLGIYGVQVVATVAAPKIVLTNPQKSGTTFTADFTTDTAGNFTLQRSITLNQDWTAVGSAFNAAVGTTQVTDSAAPAGKAFYRVRQN